eukprot:GHRR01011289.1.p1 GENE.GHRR01011289.1~~GHRR01011289.1.p1  ORF type:complete len:484 (+),score=165.02 GHRR01011289.1:149-1600(+)
MIVRLLSIALKVAVVTGGASLATKCVGKSSKRSRRVPEPAIDTSAGRIIIVSTAAIPWRTGTAVNPTLRAAHLAAVTDNEIVLVVPFLPVQDQIRIFPEGITCSTPEQQAALIKAWATEHSNLPEVNFKVLFYQARYFPASRCIFAVEDICKLVPRDQVCLVLLEEPEHLNWYRSTTRWTSHFSHVVGVLHTHYSGYARDLPGGIVNAVAVGLVCRVVCRLHCHKVVQLSQLAKGLTRSTTVNVHGVSAKYLEVGRQQAQRLRQQQQRQQQQCHQQHPVVHLKAAAQPTEAVPILQGGLPQQQSHSQLLKEWGKAKQQDRRQWLYGVTSSCFRKGCYFLGKALWDKGHGELMSLLEAHARKHGQQVPVDVYGVGPDLHAIQAEAASRGMPLVFKGQEDHCSAALQQYKVFINCCKKDVLATATAEAVAMNKWVILPDCSCNQFFKPFPTVLLFSNAAEFSERLQQALQQDPPPLTKEHLQYVA